MPAALRNIDKAKSEISRVYTDLVQLEERLEMIHDAVQNATEELFGADRHVLSALQEEALVSRIADAIVARLAPQARSQKSEGRSTGYIRDQEVANFMGVSVWTLRGWRSKGSPNSPPFVRVGGRVMYSVAALEEYMRSHGQR